MAKRKGGVRRRTRHMMKKHVRDHGKISLRKFFQTFKEGAKVTLKAEPAYQKGIFHLKFQGRLGIVKGNRGTNYEVQIMDGNKEKTVIVHPVHLEAA